MRKYILILYRMVIRKKRVGTVKKKIVKKRESLERPYNANTLSESEIRNKIISKLRMLTRRWKPKQNCIRDSGGICAEC